MKHTFIKTRSFSSKFSVSSLRLAILISAVFFFSSAFCSTASKAQSIIVRPEASVGVGTDHSFVQNYGGKVLMALNDKLRFGLKGDYIKNIYKSGGNIQYTNTYFGTGIVLEAVVGKYFNMGIGTVGNLALSKLNYNQFLVYTHLGFEYPIGETLSLLAAYQADFVFDKKFALLNCFRLGIGYKIPL